MSLPHNDAAELIAGPHRASEPYRRRGAEL